MESIPHVLFFNNRPPSIDRICDEISQMVGCAVRVVQRVSKGTGTPLKCQIAFECVTKKTVDIWGIPPGYDKDSERTLSYQSTCVPELPSEVFHTLPQRTDRWIILLVQYGIQFDTLFNAAIVAFEDLGGESKRPFSDEVRIAASQRRSTRQIRRHFRRQRNGMYLMGAILGFFGFGYVLVLAIFFVPVGLCLIAREWAAYLIRKLKAGPGRS